MNLRAILMLILVTAIWGVTFPLIYNAMPFISAGRFVTLRFALAAVVLLPWVWHLFRRQKTFTFWAGMLLGFLNGLVYVSQTIGLRTVSPAKTAFITAFYVVLVPLLAPIVKLGKFSTQAVISAILCLVGLYVLTGDISGHVRAGELWVGLCALSSAVQILCLQKITQKDHNFILLAFYQILFTVPFALIFPTTNAPMQLLAPQVIIALLFCGIIATSLALYLQTKYQYLTTPHQAAVIYCLEPVFASIFSIAINHTHLGINVIYGGLIVLAALLLSIFRPRRW